MLNEEVRVSYLITTRNRADFLQRTVDNVREFITPQDELIIFDAASTDHTAEVIEKNRDIVTLFVSEPDKGEAHGLNKGILASRGNIIKFLTDDDYFYPDAMLKSIKVLEANEEIDVLISGGITWDVDKSGNRSNPNFRRLADQYNFYNGTFVSEGITISGQGIFIKKSAIPIVGLLDCRKKLVDYEYYIRLSQSKLNIKYYDIYLYDHLVWEGSGCNNLQQTEYYKKELAEGLLALGDWKALLELPSERIASTLKLNVANRYHDDFFRILNILHSYPDSFSTRIISIMEKMTLSLLSFKEKINQYMASGFKSPCAQSIAPLSDKTMWTESIR